MKFEPVVLGKWSKWQQWTSDRRRERKILLGGIEIGRVVQIEHSRGSIHANGYIVSWPSRQVSPVLKTEYAALKHVLSV